MHNCNYLIHMYISIRVGVIAACPVGRDQKVGKGKGCGMEHDGDMLEQVVVIHIVHHYLSSAA